MKTHLRDTLTPAVIYVQSPHVFESILEGTWTVCAQITSKITDDIAEVDCKACQYLQKQREEYLATKGA